MVRERGKEGKEVKEVNTTEARNKLCEGEERESHLAIIPPRHIRKIPLVRR